MDPNVTLQRIRDLSAKLLNEVFENIDDAIALAEHVESLDEWLSNGGFLPDGWADHRGV